MARIISLVVLIVILALISVLFFQVMADFILPLFLALLTVVIFGPLHRWILVRCRGRSHLAAAVSTLVILLIFLTPLAFVLVRAAEEAVPLYGVFKAFLDKSPDAKLEKLHAAIKKGTELLSSYGVQLAAEDIEHAVVERAQQWAAPVARGTARFLGSFLLGLFVMIVAIYYFLADGQGMIRAIARLSPLDQQYQQQLFDQFGDLTRAVVLATLFSAVAQGLLAGLGFFVAGFTSVFLLTFLAMLFAMVPFVGSAAVWVPACLWLLYDGRTAAAVLLALYCVAVVSTIDNFVKPLVLRGRSNLHPLLALLSVLGGVQALGFIGIFVGPMAVAFLQTLLEMVQKELAALGKAEPGPAKV